MRKLGWYALGVAMAAFVLGSVGLLAANLYVQSHGVQQRIRTALAAALQTPVSLRKTTVTPWDGLRLDGVTLHEQTSDRPDGATDFFTASSFRVKLAWWPLLTRRGIIVEQVLLDRPRLTLRERAEPLPAEEAPAADAPAGEPRREPAASPVDTLPPAVADASPATADELPPPPAPVTILLPLIKKLRVRHGEFASLDRMGRPQVQVEGINVDGNTPDPQHARGALWFAKAALPEMPAAALTDYWTAVDYDGTTGLSVRDGHGKLAGGTLTTDLRLRPEARRWSFTTADRLENVALGQLTRASPETLPLAEGQLHGSVDLRGFFGDPESIAGGGRVWLSGARLQNFPLLKLVGQVLRIADLSQLEFKQAQMDYRMENNVLHLDGLTLVSNDGQVLLSGRYLIAEDQLDLHGRLTIDRAISHQLPQFIESNFTRCGQEAPGSRYLDFDLTGTRDDPKCNLYDRLTAGPMKGLLDNLLAPRSNHPKNGRTEGARKTRPATLDGAAPKP